MCAVFVRLKKKKIIYIYIRIYQHHPDMAVSVAFVADIGSWLGRVG